MKYLSFEVDVPENRAVRIDLSGTEANVRLMDWANFNSYKSNQAHRYYGGHYKSSPAMIRPPSPGHWYVVVDLGGAGGGVNAAVRVI